MKVRITPWQKVSEGPDALIVAGRFGGSAIQYRARVGNAFESSKRQVNSTDATLNDLFKLYLEDQNRQGRRSHKQSDGYVRLHLGPAFGEFKASRLETKHVRGFIDQKKLAGSSNASINRWLEALRRSYALGLKETSASVLCRS